VDGSTALDVGQNWGNDVNVANEMNSDGTGLGFDIDPSLHLADFANMGVTG
jgi:hypothetical protein